jgi:hypothetical protein
MEGYAARPGEAGSPPSHWPEESLVRRDVNRSTLLVFLHPQCPCSEASLEELRLVLDRCGLRVSAHALLLLPIHRPGGSGRSKIEEELAGLNDVCTEPDTGGSEARRFRVETSGHVVIYDTQGRLSYSGGITAARGQQGENLGRAAVIDLILGEGGAQQGTPVFGCPLFMPDRTAGRELP